MNEAAIINYATQAGLIVPGDGWQSKKPCSEESLKQFAMLVENHIVESLARALGKTVEQVRAGVA